MRRLLGVAAAAWLGGCALFPPPEPPPTVSEAASSSAADVDVVKENAEVAALLAYYQDLLAMPAEDLKREYQAVSQSFARERGELARLRLAMLMSLPEAGWRDDARLLALLDGAAGRRAPPESPRRQLILLMQRLVAERLREQKRADDLQRKLDSMLSIERRLRSRQPQTK